MALWNNSITNYADAKRFVDGGRSKTRRKIANNTYIEHDPYDNSYYVRLHATAIVAFSENGDIVLRTGGWYTVTTKRRMNAFLPSELHVGSRRGNWEVVQSIRLPEPQTVLYGYREWPTNEWKVGDYEKTHEAHIVGEFFDGMTIRENSNGLWELVNGYR